MQKTLNKSYIVFIFFSIIIICFIACEEITTYNNVPEIKFKNFYIEKVKDELGNIIWKGTILFDFIDGNGADLIDVEEGDTLYSIHFQSFLKDKGNYIESNYDTATSYFIYDKKMNIIKTGQNKSLMGEIQIIRLYYSKEKDTLKYKFYLIDREGNKSNIEETTDGIFQ